MNNYDVSLCIKVFTAHKLDQTFDHLNIPSHYLVFDGYTFDTNPNRCQAMLITTVLLIYATALCKCLHATLSIVLCDGRIKRPIERPSKGL